MDLAQELNLNNFTKEEKNELLAQFADSLLKRLMLRVYDKLTKEEQEEFDNLASAGDVKKINQFLEDKIPDLDEVRDEEVKSLLEEMKDFLTETKK